MKTELSWQTGLPEKSGRYAVVTDFTVMTLEFSDEYKCWNAKDSDKPWVAMSTCMNDFVNAWAEIDVDMLVDTFKKEG